MARHAATTAAPTARGTAPFPLPKRESRGAAQPQPEDTRAGTVYERLVAEWPGDPSRGKL